MSDCEIEEVNELINAALVGIAPEFGGIDDRLDVLDSEVATLTTNVNVVGTEIISLSQSFPVALVCTTGYNTTPSNSNVYWLVTGEHADTYPNGPAGKYFPNFVATFDGYLTGVSAHIAATGNGTNELSVISLYKLPGSALITLVPNIDMSTPPYVYTHTFGSTDFPFNRGDVFYTSWTTPSWVTKPSGVRVGITIQIAKYPV